MPATGELIRLMNYIDDIATTLRRISASVPAMATAYSSGFHITRPRCVSVRWKPSVMPIPVTT